ncbi:heat shock protein [Cavenderia fasciculata]|uniref:Heat shock protein n=1 Tax=Cavenderia fasciculata TaxID=261658 RepID=F4PJH0_CACFS|nr:heat shock protein [Cavenderia fasciculata]EGG24456.1 heat shock protein [Cavenderia fasciculata]|eukprot:XP_004362307.1 heat shock protein [Cavenderia fasciculata]
MSFFGATITKDESLDLILDEGMTFNLTNVVISRESKGTGKCWLVAHLIEEDPETGNEEIIEKVTIATLVADKIEQVNVNLVFDSSLQASIKLEGDDKCPTHICVSGIMMASDDEDDMPHCDDEDCEHQDCGMFGEEDSEDMEDSDDDDDEDEDIPALKVNGNNKKPTAKITEIPDKSVAKPKQPQQQPSKKQAANPSAAAPKQPQQQQQQQPKQQQQQKPQQQQPKRPNGSESKQQQPIKKSKN